MLGIDAEGGVAMITRAHVMPYLGQHVVVRTHDGMIHHGMLHHVTDDGMFLRRLGGGATMANWSEAPHAPSPVAGSEATTDEPDVALAWWPFFFLPWMSVAAFGPWGWWW